MTATPHLRKAAILIRSLDADTAAGLLAQLSPEEAAAIRAAIRELGPLDPEEQADVAAEFRRTAPVAHETSTAGVELKISSAAKTDADGLPPIAPNILPSTGRRFEFLDEAPTEALVPYLAREHVQTIAVVLSYLAPHRAAAVLAALPASLQAEVIERLSALGETDPDSLTVLERELSAWLAHRTAGRRGSSRRGDAVVSILAATDSATRDGIMISLKTHKAPLAKQIAPLLPARSHAKESVSQADNLRRVRASELANSQWEPRKQTVPQPQVVSPTQPAPRPAPIPPRMSFNDLLLLSPTELSALLRDVEPDVLVLALAGSTDELVDRICAAVPRRTAKAFRRQVARLGPTRLSDVEAAQGLVAGAAALRFSDRHRATASATY